MQLYIGNKNYSSWSLRPWLAMRQLGIPFEEVKLRLDFSPGSAFKTTLERIGSPGKVPVLIDDALVVWDTLAIVEYLNDRFPDKAVWPRDMRQRARARSLCAEMHSGFTTLRGHCPMNLEASLPGAGAKAWDGQAGLRSDLARIEQIWGEQLAASGGPFLFGEFSAADAFFAPVATRMKTYALPAMQQWLADALAEHDFLDFDEPYRSSPRP